MEITDFVTGSVMKGKGLGSNISSIKTAYVLLIFIHYHYQVYLYNVILSQTSLLSNVSVKKNKVSGEVYLFNQAPEF